MCVCVWVHMWNAQTRACVNKLLTEARCAFHFESVWNWMRGALLCFSLLVKAITMHFRSNMVATFLFIVYNSTNYIWSLLSHYMFDLVLTFRQTMNPKKNRNETETETSSEFRPYWALSILCVWVRRTSSSKLNAEMCYGIFFYNIPNT